MLWIVIVIVVNCNGHAIAAALAVRTLETLTAAQFVVYEVSQVALVAFG